MKYWIYTGLIILSALLVSCEKWYDTADVSHVSYLPQFTLEGGDFVSIVQQDSGEFEDPGATAYVNGSEVQVYYLSNNVDVTTPGVYNVIYYAENSEGFSNTASRIVAVTNEDVSSNDLSGTYAGTNWEEVQVAVIKVSDGGLYEMEDVMGFPGYAMPGRFVDLGQEELILLPGEGYFGKYDGAVGHYTNRTLSWNVILLTAPYEGYVIPVTWRKVE
jgi:Bacterial surface protein, Ig-like domain